MDHAEVIGLLIICSGIALILSFVIPIVAYRRWRRKGLLGGCILQPVAFVLLFIVVSFVISSITNLCNHAGTMVCVRCVEEDRDCRMSETWYIKDNGTCHYEFEKGSHNHSVVQCGNDYYESEHSVERVASELGIKEELGMEVYFDLNRRTVTPIYYNKSVDIVSVDWDKVENYFGHAVGINEKLPME